MEFQCGDPSSMHLINVMFKIKSFDTQFNNKNEKDVFFLFSFFSTFFFVFICFSKKNKLYNGKSKITNNVICEKKKTINAQLNLIDNAF